MHNNAKESFENIFSFKKYVCVPHCFRFLIFIIVFLLLLNYTKVILHVGMSAI